MANKTQEARPWRRERWHAFVRKRARRATKVRPGPAQGAVAAPARGRQPARVWCVYLLLFLATLAVYSQVRHFDFVNFDDPEYIGENNHVRAGLTWNGLVWAFTSFDAANWFPLTWLSHMAAYQLFGLRSGWHHLTNVWFHALASLLLFAALRRMTGALWRSALVAFLFALHPLHVESVAWIAERKDVLCAFFWFLTLWCYARYAQQPGLGRYLLVLLGFCGGLMAKPMIVTLPFVLLLLDVWPLRRANRLAVLWEKLPLFALAAGVSLATYVAQQRGHAVRLLSSLPAGLRVANALVTYIVYIVRTFWPAKLAVFYPYSHDLPVWRAVAAGVALAGITLLVLRWFRAYPYLAVGWFWYLGTLVPVIGFVQVGGQSSADRYTYLPMVGLAIMLSWGAADFLKRYPHARAVAAVSAVAVCSACLVLTWLQLRYWANSGALFEHAVDVTAGNHIAHNNLAAYDLTQGRDEEAWGHVIEALRIKPNYAEAHVNLATILRRQGQAGESEREYRVAFSLQPDNVEAHSGYGALLLGQGRTNEALREFQEVVELRPEYANGRYDLGRMLATLGRTDEAVAQFSEAIRLRPDHAEAYHSLGVALVSRGRLNEALAQFAAEARLKPSDASVHNTLGMLLASAGRLDEAIAQFSEALRIKPDFAAARRGLESTLARRGRGVSH
jgi:tetratricopeptide (TPR) repeat protein